MKSIYIHIPFCEKICSYCDFCKVFYNKDLIDKYLTELEKEINKYYKNEPIKTIYIGGGTPSCLSIEQLNKLFEITNKINLEKEYEFTIEANINDICEEKLTLFKSNNINRISIGVETINENYFSFLNRGTKKETVKEKIKLAQKYFENINIDLMYGFPNQTKKELINDLSFITELNPSHISIYSLIIEEHTKIYIDKISPLDEELEAEMYYEIINYLKENGYIHYEISNFSKKGYESKHNLVYWNNEKYYGFGLGASGYIENIRYTNTRSLKKYLEGNYVFEKEIITKEIDMENEVIFGLRKTEGISRSKFLKKYCFDIEQIFDIMDLVNKKMLKIDGDNIFIPENNLYISNSILVNFIGGSKNGQNWKNKSIWKRS